ncbi:MAG: branched-chain amino acid ABC transporter permease [Sumerlaeia bacterium]
MKFLSFLRSLPGFIPSWMKPAFLMEKFNRLPKPARIGFWLALLVFALAMPVFGFDQNDLYKFVRIGIFTIAALGLNVQVGYTGLLNLGFAGFIAIGAYTCGVLIKTYEWTFWLALPASVLHAALWGILLGLPTLRLTGDYFAIVTFGFSELVLLVAKNWGSVTGGAQGLVGVPRPSLGAFGEWLQTIGVDKSLVVFSPIDNAPYWFLTVLCVALSIIVLWRVTHSRVGRAWRAIREDEIAAEACGINGKWYKTLAFAVSAGLGGLSGGLLCLLVGGVYPNNFRFLESVIVLVYVVFGGMGSILGSVAGTVALMWLLENLRDVIENFNRESETITIDAEARYVIFGLILIAVMRLRPEGIFPSKRVKMELHPSTYEEARREDATLFDFARDGERPLI